MFMALAIPVVIAEVVGMSHGMIVLTMPVGLVVPVSIAQPMRTTRVAA